MNELEYNFDEEIHAISKDFAAILGKFPIELDETQRLIAVQAKQVEYIRKYAKYLMEFDKEKCFDILSHYLMPNCMGYTEETHSFIYRPPWIVGSLSQFATLSLKFKRSENDNLNDPK